MRAEAGESERRRWAIGEARTVYDNPWIQVREYKAVAPTGAPALYGLVHMKRVAVGVLPIDAEGHTFLVGQERFPFGRYSWELPEGGGAQTDPPLLTAQRELAEETGLQAVEWLELFSEVQLSNSVTDERAWAYLAWNLAAASALSHLDDSEDLAVRRVPFSQAVGMAAQGEILDVFTLVMLLKADHMLRNGKLPPELARSMLGQ